MGNQKNWNGNKEGDNSGFTVSQLPSWHKKAHTLLRRMFTGLDAPVDAEQDEIQNIAKMLERMGPDARKRYLESLKIK